MEFIMVLLPMLMPLLEAFLKKDNAARRVDSLAFASFAKSWKDTPAGPTMTFLSHVVSCAARETPDGKQFASDLLAGAMQSRAGVERLLAAKSLEPAGPTISV